MYLRLGSLEVGEPGFELRLRQSGLWILCSFLLALVGCGIYAPPEQSHCALEERGERNPNGQLSCSGLHGAPTTTAGVRVFAESVVGKLSVGNSWMGGSRGSGFQMGGRD